MKRLIALASAFLLVSCAALPVINPPDDSLTKTFSCPSPYPREKNRYIHAIEVRRGNQTQTAMIGVTLIDPSNRTLSCALVSTEGMAVFEAVSGPDGLAVSRALPPLDSMDFARNMMNDIELIFLAPKEAPGVKGVLAGGQEVCRYQEKDGSIDVVAGPDGIIRIRRYSKGGSLKRGVTLSGGRMNPYSAIELQASEMLKYTLVMTLIESEKVLEESTRKDEKKGPIHEKPDSGK